MRGIEGCSLSGLRDGVGERSSRHPQAQGAGMSLSADTFEAWANAIVGLGISAALVQLLRFAGWWDANAMLIAVLFFGASVGRSYGLRRVFRRFS